MTNLHECCRTSGSNLRPPEYQSDVHPTKLPGPAQTSVSQSVYSNTVFSLSSVWVLKKKCPGCLKKVKRGVLIRNSQIPRGLSKTLACFLKYGSVVTTKVLNTHYRHSHGSCGLKILCYFSFTAESAMIQTHRTLLYVSGIPCFL